MKTGGTIAFCFGVICGLAVCAVAEEQPKPFPGKQSEWHGFVRHDFEVDGKPVLVVSPKAAAAGRPWVWHGEFFGHKPVPDIALLKRGFHVVYMQVPDMLGSPQAVEHWNKFYAELTGKYGFARKAALVGLSRGGLYCYNWAAANPEKVACIYGDAPVCDFKSWPGGKGKGKGSERDWKLVLERYGFKDEAVALAYRKNPVDNLEPLAKAKVPLLHVYGDADDVVPWEENTGLIAERYKKLGGEITLIAKKGVGHHPHGLDDPTPIVEFIAKHGSQKSQTSPAAEVQFNRDIRPILSENCFQCHGPDVHQRQAELRLDTREGATAEHDGGNAIVAGDVKASRLMERILSTVADERMPPEKTGRKLTPQQVELLRRWIEQGAKYEQHWSLIPPSCAEPPRVKNAAWSKNPIDRFVLAKLEMEGLSPSVEADKGTLLRRVTLDLTGLPPTPEEREAFLADDSPLAYEKVVERLLNSPRYGERMAMHWLDLARYADTNGYNNDEDRTQWMWRDWVIASFNRNQPYDQFIVEQLAGDLLPGSTNSQKIATAFNRNHVLTTEGGIIDEEYRVEYVADRVHTTATVFLGLSLQCARCHDHKFDPLTQREYYSFFAFFNNIAEKTVGYNQAKVAEPFIKVPTQEQQALLDKLAARKVELERKRLSRATEVDADLEKWERDALASGKLPQAPLGLIHAFHLDEGKGDQVADNLDAKRGRKIEGKAKWGAGKVGGALEFDGQSYVPLGEVGALEQNEPFSFSAWVFLTSNDASTVLSKMDEGNAFRGYDLIIEQGRVATHIVHHWPDNGLKVIAKEPMSLNAWHHVAISYDGKSKGSGVGIYVDGKPQLTDITTDTLSGKETIKTDKPFHLGRRTSSAPFRGMLDEIQIYRAALSPADVAELAKGQTPAGIAEILKTPSSERSAAQKESLKRHYLDQVDPVSRTLTTELGQIAKEQAELEKGFPATMVMEEMPTPRQAFVLNRGQYDQPGATVSPGVPASLPPLPKEMPANRLALAKWLVDPAHPLTARVAINRWWQLYFGTGIVETVEDFGSQGAWPSHHELLDWLATEFIRSGWNVKEMQRLIVTSATYRQASRVSPTLLERDPKNRLLSRGPRFRLPAETVRDNALALSGLLKEKIGGPSVKPYQPDGLWQDVSVERRAVYKQDEGDGLYRRGMYTFWKRTCPPPGMMTFDAPDRETCTIRRARTNTPLQALVLMNDPTFVEASRKLAERVLKSGSDKDEVLLTRLYRIVLCRDPHENETATLLPLLSKTRERFKASPEKAMLLLKIGSSPRDEKLNAAELAAWTTLCSLVLNLDEAITKE